MNISSLSGEPFTLDSIRRVMERVKVLELPHFWVELDNQVITITLKPALLEDIRKPHARRRYSWAYKLHTALLSHETVAHLEADPLIQNITSRSIPVIPGLFGMSLCPAVIEERRAFLAWLLSLP